MPIPAAVRRLPLFLLIVLLAATIHGAFPPAVQAETYRQAMRRFVQDIAAFARTSAPGFLIIPQNGVELFSLGQDSTGPLAADYAASVSGTGQESLFYGYPDDDQPTADDVSAYLTGYLDLAKNAGVPPLVADYCATHAKMNDSYAKNAAKGYVSFAAPRRDLDVIPDYPTRPYNVHQGDVTSLSAVKNLLYLLSPDEGYATVEAYLDDLRNTDYDLIIMDASFADAMLTPAQVASLKTKKNGGRRLVAAYMSIGEAEVYRDYWQTSWSTSPPPWLDAENPDWAGNYKVRYWMDGWRRIIFGDADSYAGKLVAAGFDGTYLDIIDAFEYYESRFGPNLPDATPASALLLLGEDADASASPAP